MYDELKRKLAAAASKLIAGDPAKEETLLGPLITEDDARRIERWVHQAVARGAKVVCGGVRNGSRYDATFVEDVPDDADLFCKEALGPLATLERFSDFAVACDRVNDSVLGLQAGVFTRNIHSAFYAFDHLEVGGVVINDRSFFSRRRHALRRRDGKRPGTRGHSIRHRGHDRTPAAGAQPHRPGSPVGAA